MQLYCLTFPNGKKYIGITSNTAQERFKEHCASSKNKHCCQRAIHKYGKENVALTVLAECDNWELLCLSEQEAIEKFNTLAPNGYNLTLGGEGLYGYVYTDEHRKRISEATTGKVYSSATIKKMSEAGKKKIMTESHLINLRKTVKRGVDNPRYKVPRTDEVKAKISKKLTGIKLSPERIAKMSIANSNPSIESRIKMSKSNRDRINRPCKNNSGYQGVYYVKSRGKFRARCVHMKKEHALGSFDTAEEASAAYQNFVANLTDTQQPYHSKTSF